MAAGTSAEMLEQRVPVSSEAEHATFGPSIRHIAWLAELQRQSGDDHYRYLLVLRFALVNALGIALLSVAWIQGLVGQVIAADETYLSVAIFVVFVCGMALCTRKILKVSTELNRVRSFDPLTPSIAAAYIAKMRGCSAGSRTIIAGALRLKLSQSIVAVRHIAGSLVLLGLIGTVIGFIIALAGVNPEAAADIDAIGPMVSTLISGMSTALYTTLVGSILNIWLMVNYQLLAGGTVKLITAIQEFGERNAGD